MCLSPNSVKTWITSLSILSVWPSGARYRWLESRWRKWTRSLYNFELNTSQDPEDKHYKRWWIKNIKIAPKAMHAAHSNCTMLVIEAPEKCSLTTLPHTFDHCSHLGNQEPSTSVWIIIRVPTQNSKILSGYPSGYFAYIWGSLLKWHVCLQAIHAVE